MGGNESINSNIYSSMIYGVGQLVQDGDVSMVEIGEKLFKQSFEILGKSPEESVFLSLSNMYSYVPDYKSVIDLVEAMRENPEWPNPTSLSYSVCLKALNQYGQKYGFSYDEGWNHVDRILAMMEDDKIIPHQAIFSLLFNLCSGRFCGKPDLQKLNPSDYFVLKYEAEESVENKEKIKEECMKFVDWAMV